MHLEVCKSYVTRGIPQGGVWVLLVDDLLRKLE